MHGRMAWAVFGRQNLKIQILPWRTLTTHTVSNSNTNSNLKSKAYLRVKSISASSPISNSDSDLVPATEFKSNLQANSSSEAEFKSIANSKSNLTCRQRPLTDIKPPSSNFPVFGKQSEHQRGQQFENSVHFDLLIKQISKSNSLCKSMAGEMKLDKENAVLPLAVHEPQNGTPAKKAKLNDRFLVKKLSEHAFLPVRGSVGAAGYDLAR